VHRRIRRTCSAQIAAIAASTPDVSAQLADTLIVVVHGYDGNHLRTDTPRPIHWYGTVVPTGMLDTDALMLYKSIPNPFTDFADGLTGMTTSRWVNCAWAVEDDATALSGGSLPPREQGAACCPG
jgi:spermidine/putrescine-binding protein